MMHYRYDIALMMVGILIIGDSFYTNAILPIISIIAFTSIMSYTLLSSLLDRMKEVKRIKRNSSIAFWEYRKQAIDWQSIIFTIMFFYFQTLVSGTLKYLILIMAVSFLLVLLANTFIALSEKSQILAIEESKIINIRNKIEILNLRKFRQQNKSEDKISLKNRWKTVVILKDDFIDSDKMIESIAEGLCK